MKKLLVLLLLVAFHVRATAETESRSRIQYFFRETLARFRSVDTSCVKLVFSNKAGHLMESRPTICGFFQKKRTYKILISIDQKYESFLNSLSDDALIGWFAHELGHIIDYQEQGRLGTIWRGIQYIFLPKGRRELEHKADFYAVENGFGCEILASLEAEEFATHLTKRDRRKIKTLYPNKQTVLKFCEDYEEQKKKN